jgi:endonuclease YncB( thermonuclease family)
MRTPETLVRPGSARPLDLTMDPVRLPGIAALETWLEAHLTDPEDRRAIAETARDCLTRFAHAPDLPVTVQFWPLSRTRRYGVSYASSDRGITAYLEVRLAPCLAA